MKAFDASFISLALLPDSPAPVDPETNKPVDRASRRIEELIERLSDQGEKVIIPTPALSEFLVLAGPDGPAYLNELSTSSVFKIEPFDERAAIEAAHMQIAAKRKGDKKGGSESSWSKIKFDRQIVAIAKVNGADTIYSTDRDVERFGRSARVKVLNVYDLPSPMPEQLPLPDAEPTADAATSERSDGQDEAKPEPGQLPEGSDGPAAGPATPKNQKPSQKTASKTGKCHRQTAKD